NAQTLCFFLLFNFLVLSDLLGETFCYTEEEHVYVDERKTWLDAQKYCREHHTDLLSINSKYEDGNLSLSWANKALPDSWIGLYQDDSDSLRWSGGEIVSYTLLTNDEKMKKANCGTKSKHGWHLKDCKLKRTFNCFQNTVVLVKENKTWEKAMEHCHQLGKTLVNLLTEDSVVKALQSSREAQTNHLWINLRYLSNNWLWVMEQGHLQNPLLAHVMTSDVAGGKNRKCRWLKTVEASNITALLCVRVPE
uniref:C-type lectin domain-containing protein n=1 Tax=Gouania willdenowi TaxID=441366 RepID=A0A8C5HIJ1_GOUWI